MVKGSHVIIITGILLLCLPLLVPYMQYDIRQSPSSWFDFNRPLIAHDYVLLGTKTKLSYFPLIWSLIPFFFYMRKRSKASVITLLIFSIVLLLIQIVLNFALTAEPSFYYGYENVTLLIGYWFGTLGAIILVMGSFKGLIEMQKNPGIDRKSRSSDDDLLDSSI